VPTVSVTFVEEGGTVRTIDGAAVGRSLMDVGREAAVAGILADCGGACACATCHVYVDEDWFERVGPPHEVEDDLLGVVADARRPTSRLSCQIRLYASLDGLRVTVAPYA
jgi:2Fe-2S ferredoxin